MTSPWDNMLKEIQSERPDLRGFHRATDDKSDVIWIQYSGNDPLGIRRAIVTSWRRHMPALAGSCPEIRLETRADV